MRKPRFTQLRRRSIQRQITTLGLALTALVLAGFAVGMVLHEAANRRQSLEASMTTEAEIIGRNSSAAVTFANDEEANEILASLAASRDVQQARIFLPDGRTLGRYTADRAGTECHALRPAGGQAWDLRWCGAALHRPILLHGKVVGTVAMEVSLASTYRALASTIVVSLALAALAFGLSIPLWRRVAARVAEPLKRLVELTERVSHEQDFRLRATASGSREVDLLANGFNQMMSQLQQRDERLNHELHQRRQAEVRLNDLAYFDPVTGLHNRHYFLECIDAAVDRAAREQGRCALIYIDLDGFKQVNDTLGHDRGDELLKEVGRRLTDTLRRSDGVCRLGGDEFAVIIDDDIHIAQVEAVAAKLVEVLAAPYRLSDQRGAQVSASIGACLYPDDADDRDSMMRHADSAMYRAKERGKNRYWLYHAGGSEPPSRRQQLEQALDGAHDRGELHLVYQPQVLMASAHDVDGNAPVVFGFEALLRWRHPTLGLISPVEFIPLAEATGVIEPIGEWVLQEASARLVQWRKIHPRLQMSVNLSARQLASDEAIDRLIGMLASSGLPSGAVELELTESLLVDRTELMLGRLGRLRSAGFGLAIDDFGTGYSSLAYLDSFPITTLKIDRAFVRSLTGAARGDAIARAIVAIGAAIGADVIAEGIETAAQAHALHQLGCRRGQGYLYAAPLGEGGAFELLRALPVDTEVPA
ncbi:MAG TPA: EAL domain-containing protein [Ideonella sp.]|uniref:putative bifunctional diguanylate cyclase/phosphodiesterase n=1 Tax=Ideonella sp. TaxID=1929293 RepID=UPI002E381001|nr:EAL domain-containing protein [Ideonella sp.]HEX5686396.1 EAL domain-containing protein [Ideonella sp.]